MGNICRSPMAEKMFAAMDADSDGSVSEDEKSTFDSKMQDRMQSLQIMAQIAGQGGPEAFADAARAILDRGG